MNKIALWGFEFLDQQTEQEIARAVGRVDIDVALDNIRAMPSLVREGIVLAIRNEGRIASMLSTAAAEAIVHSTLPGPTRHVAPAIVRGLFEGLERLVERAIASGMTKEEIVERIRGDTVLQTRGRGKREHVLGVLCTGDQSGTFLHRSHFQGCELRKRQNQVDGTFVGMVQTFYENPNPGDRRELCAVCFSEAIALGRLEVTYVAEEPKPTFTDLLREDRTKAAAFGLLHEIMEACGRDDFEAPGWRRHRDNVTAAVRADPTVIQHLPVFAQDEIDRVSSCLATIRRLRAARRRDAGAPSDADRTSMERAKADIHTLYERFSPFFATVAILAQGRGTRDLVRDVRGLIDDFVDDDQREEARQVIDVAWRHVRRIVQRDLPETGRQVWRGIQGFLYWFLLVLVVGVPMTLFGSLAVFWPHGGAVMWVGYFLLALLVCAAGVVRAGENADSRARWIRAGGLLLFAALFPPAIAFVAGGDNVRVVACIFLIVGWVFIIVNAVMGLAMDAIVNLAVAAARGVRGAPAGLVQSVIDPVARFFAGQYGIELAQREPRGDSGTTRAPGTRNPFDTFRQIVTITTLVASLIVIYTIVVVVEATLREALGYSNDVFYVVQGAWLLLTLAGWTLASMIRMRSSHRTGTWKKSDEKSITAEQNRDVILAIAGTRWVMIGLTGFGLTALPTTLSVAQSRVGSLAADTYLYVTDQAAGAGGKQFDEKGNLTDKSASPATVPGTVPAKKQTPLERAKERFNK